VALQAGDACVAGICETYRRRRDALCDASRASAGRWRSPWRRCSLARIPERFAAEGSVAFARRLLDEAEVATSPGVGFGEHGEGFVRFALVENEARIRQAVRGIGGC